MASEVKWSCGCHEVDGELVRECTQSAPPSELRAEHHAVAKPFSAKCFRTAPSEPTEPEPDTNGDFDDSPAVDAETRAEEAEDEVAEAVAEEKPHKKAHTLHTMDAPAPAPAEAKLHKKKKA
jgi:hypothetical protein